MNHNYVLLYGFFNPFHATGIFLYPLKTLEKQRFLKFSGGIERDQWHGMDQRASNLHHLLKSAIFAEIFNKNKPGTTKKNLSNYKILVTIISVTTIISLLKYIDNIKIVDFGQKLLMTVKM